MTTSQTRLRTSPIAALVNRVVPLTFTVLFGKAAKVQVSKDISQEDQSLKPD
jgi:hypothetical protein